MLGNELLLGWDGRRNASEATIVAAAEKAVSTANDFGRNWSWSLLLGNVTLKFGATSAEESGGGANY